MVDLKLALNTYAAGDDPNALANEVAVGSAWVYIFNEHGALENPGRTAVLPAPSGSAADGSGRLNDTWRVTVGRKDIYVLLNAGHLTRSGTAVDLASYNPYSKTELETLMTDPANFPADFSGCGEQRDADERQAEHERHLSRFDGDGSRGTPLCAHRPEPAPQSRPCRSCRRGQEHDARKPPRTAHAFAPAVESTGAMPCV